MISLQRIIDEYAGGNTAEQATYVLGRMYLLDRNYPEAVRYFQMFIDNFRDSHMHRAASFAGLAICHENQGEPALAAAKFEEAIAADPDGANVGDYHLGAVRNYLSAGDENSARTHVEALQADFAGTQWEATGVRLFYESGFTISGS
jgi:tetratricopeptide (TPR) repeat protein